MRASSILYVSSANPVYPVILSIILLELGAWSLELGACELPEIHGQD